MATRLKLQARLEEILGSENVYFQPPANIAMRYPCIIYKREKERADYADDSLYLLVKNYLVTVVDRDPDSQIPDAIQKLRYAQFDRFFASDNLNHWVFRIYN